MLISKNTVVTITMPLEIAKQVREQLMQILPAYSDNYRQLFDFYDLLERNGV